MTTIDKAELARAMLNTIPLMHRMIGGMMRQQHMKWESPAAPPPHQHPPHTPHSPHTFNVPVPPPFSHEMPPHAAQPFNQPIAPPHFGLLMLLARKPMTQSELAHLHRVSPSTMSATVDAMARHGWIHRQRSDKDRRVVHINITPEGREHLTNHDSQVLAGIQAMLEPLSPEELEQLYTGVKLMQRVMQNAFSEMPPHGVPPGEMPDIIPLFTPFNEEVEDFMIELGDDDQPHIPPNPPMV
jgi:DNA-binding MarR family transcriptional regulator